MSIGIYNVSDVTIMCGDQVVAHLDHVEYEPAVEPGAPHPFIENRVYTIEGEFVATPEQAQAFLDCIAAATRPRRQKRRVGVHCHNRKRWSDQYLESYCRGEHMYWTMLTHGYGPVDCQRPAARAQRYFGGERRAVNRYAASRPKPESREVGRAMRDAERLLEKHPEPRSSWMTGRAMVSE